MYDYYRNLYLEYLCEEVPLPHNPNAVRTRTGNPQVWKNLHGLEVWAMAMDIFYRDTPHPEFGNRYFGMFIDQQDRVMITNADRIEGAEFAMIKDSEGNLHYSAHRHDYKEVDGKMIDGGRAYIRSSGAVELYKVRDGEFVDESR